MNTKLFLTTFFFILFSLGIGFVFTIPTRAQEPAVETTTLSLTAHHIHGFLLTPTNPTMTQTIPIDAPTGVSFHFGSTSQDLSITLIGPSDQRVNLGDAATSLAQSYIISDPTTIGANYVFGLSNPEPGLWSYQVQSTIPLTQPRAVLLTILSSSPIRTGMLGGGRDYRVDQSMSLLRCGCSNRWRIQPRRLVGDQQWGRNRSQPYP